MKTEMFFRGGCIVVVTELVTTVIKDYERGPLGACAVVLEGEWREIFAYETASNLLGGKEVVGVLIDRPFGKGWSEERRCCRAHAECVGCGCRLTYIYAARCCKACARTLKEGRNILPSGNVVVFKRCGGDSATDTNIWEEYEVYPPG